MRRNWMFVIGVGAFTILAVSDSAWVGQTTAAQSTPGSSTAVVIDTSSVRPTYANFSRVTATPEEVIVDFGLNDQPSGPPKRPMQIEERVVMNFYTAKRLLGALQTSIERHEEVFGTVETDVERRVKSRK